MCAPPTLGTGSCTCHRSRPPRHASSPCVGAPPAPVLNTGAEDIITGAQIDILIWQGVQFEAAVVTHSEMRKQRHWQLLGNESNCRHISTMLRCVCITGWTAQHSNCLAIRASANERARASMRVRGTRARMRSVEVS